MELPQLSVRMIVCQPTPFGRNFMVKQAIWGSFVSAAVMIGLSASLAAAGPIEDRQAAMKQNGKMMGVLVPMLKGEKPYDAAVVKEAAATMAEDFKKAAASFPEGSDKGPPETYAKPEIWSDPEGFKAAFEKAVAAVDTLAMSTDEASFKAALPAVGSSCGGCHEKFRRPKD
jgi:cytochrome c556